MRPRAYLFLVAAAVLIGLGIWYWRGRLPAPPPPPPVAAHPETLVVPPQPLRIRPAVLSDLEKQAVEQSASPECREFWQRVLKEEVVQYGAPIPFELLQPAQLTKYNDFVQMFQELPTGDRCAGLSAKHPLYAVHAQFLAECGKLRSLIQAVVEKKGKPNTRQLALKMATCYQTLVGYDVALIDRMSAKQSLADISDLGVLRAKYLALADRDPAHPDTQGLLAIAQRMVEVAPGNVSALHTAADAALQGWQTADDEHRSEYAAAAHRYLSTLESQAPQDPMLPGLHLMEHRLSGDYAGVQQIASRVMSQDTELGTYYQAWAAYAQQNYAESERILSLYQKTGHSDFMKTALAQIQGHADSPLPADQVFTDEIVRIRNMEPGLLSTQ